ncbi:oxidoreductase [Methanobrevibacter millerae]|uniref:2,4-dienoyl-CoA reductase n=1 Tax=Methanobrevibacter millerae TaxID=230361 RepID=A0A1G5VHZ4_9EURY|nr:NADH-dependent flavin oxidoreductase [Methanobrevibacter millerae]SDA45493.1 2,4-dienoyl-CoA reductase [Methanobrevibacter millerae]
MKDIFDKCDFGDFKLNSRIVRTGLWESQKELGKLSPEIFLRYERLAKSHVGIITTELISLYDHDRFSDYSHSINSPAFIKEFKYLTELTHKHDVPVLAQIGFVDCNVNGKQSVSVNDLTLEDIRQIQSDYIVAAKKISFADFDGIQLTMGNTYFFSKMINPKENRRKDDYGGSAFNRLRMILEIIKVIKSTTNLHVNCRINASDEALEISEILEKIGADSIQITKPSSPQYFRKDSENKNILFDVTDEIAESVDIPVILGGGLDDADSINDLINSTSIEFVSMQRPFVFNPTFLNDWKEGKETQTLCRTCNNCYWKKTSTCHVKMNEEDLKC